jgi:TPR repeat protein
MALKAIADTGDLTMEAKQENYKDAVKLLSDPEQLTHYQSKYQLGQMYELGQGVDKDMHKAGRLYQTAAWNGNVDALKRLANNRGEFGAFQTAAEAETLASFIDKYRNV